ncbi:hypothetical protein M595_4744 [Lyngbya aestuarii BL J]|uniref:Uncharacterized protein n=1 Tax=Lyngbya aestuarii BL J TaxID=1348334 RepID=U7QDM2_9CYAN|nr:hypothetical protein M595_4744 [Lyngbya aestuarii BL J]
MRVHYSEKSVSRKLSPKSSLIQLKINLKSLQNLKLLDNIQSTP